MKISTEIASIANIVGMEKSVELCAKAGFDGVKTLMASARKLADQFEQM